MCKIIKEILSRKTQFLCSVGDFFFATVLRSSYSLELPWFHELLRRKDLKTYGLDDAGRVSYTKDHSRRFISQQRWNSIKDSMQLLPGEVTENSFVITKIGSAEYNGKYRGVFWTHPNKHSKSREEFLEKVLS